MVAKKNECARELWDRTLFGCCLASVELFRQNRYDALLQIAGVVVLTLIYPAHFEDVPTAQH